ncbi:helix-turn-helix domain-containing protein [Streptomyces collinus]|uniref:DNA-binding protein n=1 Tax=Streptomyces collinus (strain DSM 40733 / Tue 365) TaxID=1214242 RepID=S5UX48_STRC3|nr:helix-turn-helix domain-containing protein [Streptomyces collinus]AGS67619.1 DNA-binding protein [Streptomyces collinus Tu 365]UJA06303.1 PucR family transcriptional regulator [Streptomyces collinus]UJA12527.1 PucR family transcriptional regulator [Streptomyces collinus]
MGDVAGRADEAPDTRRPQDTDGAWAAQLLDHLRPAGREPRRVVGWLGPAVGAVVCLRDARGGLLAGEPLALDETVLADLVTGRISAAALEDGGRHVRMVGIPHPQQGPAAGAVLAVSRPEPFDRRAAEIVNRTASVLELLLRERELTEAGRRLRRATADLRLAILQLLMVEDTVSARRVAAGLWPGLLEADAARVYVLEGSPADRDRLAEDCADVTGGEALVVRCPAMDGHVIVVTPRPAAGERLRSLVDGRPGVFLGGSLRQRLARTATAYAQAISALAVARFRPDQTAVFAERTRPARLMEPAALRAWSAGVLRPLDRLPHHIRAELLATTRLGLEFTAVNAAKVLGVSRNTVRARMDRVETLLGTDFSDLSTRAAAHLALNTEAAREPHDSDEPPPPAPARLGDLLTSAALRTWADDLLGRLDADGRDLRGTLCAWLAADSNAERTARDLGVHAQTVREHVRAAEPVLERQLLAMGSDLYEVVLAHLSTGALAVPALGR